MKKVFSKGAGIIVIIILLTGILTVNTLQYIHDINTPNASSVYQPTPIIGVSGSSGVFGTDTLNDDNTSNPTPTPSPTEGITGVTVNEDNFVGEETIEGE